MHFKYVYQSASDYIRKPVEIRLHTLLAGISMETRRTGAPSVNRITWASVCTCACLITAIAIETSCTYCEGNTDMLVIVEIHSIKTVKNYHCWANSYVVISQLKIDKSESVWQPSWFCPYLGYSLNLSIQHRTHIHLFKERDKKGRDLKKKKKKYYLKCKSRFSVKNIH